MDNLFSNQAKRAAHSLIDWAMPRNDSIALISCGVSYFMYSSGGAYIPFYVAKTVNDVCYGIGGWSLWGVCAVTTAPYLSGKVSPEMVEKLTIISGLATSILCNLVVRVFYGPTQRNETEEKHPSNHELSWPSLSQRLTNPQTLTNQQQTVATQQTLVDQQQALANQSKVLELPKPVAIPPLPITFKKEEQFEVFSEKPESFKRMDNAEEYLDKGMCWQLCFNQGVKV